MANGRECIHCGFQETPHDHTEVLHKHVSGDEVYPPYKKSLFQCIDESGFDDGVKHDEDCYLESGHDFCGGNCEAFAAMVERRAEMMEYRARNTMMFVKEKNGRQRLVIVDIGS